MENVKRKKLEAAALQREFNWETFQDNEAGILLTQTFGISSSECFVFRNVRRRLEYVCSSQDRGCNGKVQSAKLEYPICHASPHPHPVFPPIFKSRNLQFLEKLQQNENGRKFPPLFKFSPRLKFSPLFKCESLTFGKSFDLFPITICTIYHFFIALIPAPKSKPQVIVSF